jgi:IPT/TIG domain
MPWGLLRRFSCVASIFAGSLILIGNLGCGGGSMGPGQPAQSPAPAISSFSPNVVTLGSGTVTLQIIGNGFVSGSTVTWNGTKLPTTYSSATQLSASVSAALTSTAGSITIAIVNPDGQSSKSSGSPAATLTVDSGVPTITQLAPATLPAGSPATDVAISGTNFVPTSVAFFGGSQRETMVQSATQLTVVLTAADLALAQTVPITVATPAPGGGTSAASSFTVVAPPPPTLASLTPASILVGSSDTPITVTGANFTPSSHVAMSGASLPTNYVAATTLTTTIPAKNLATASPLSLSVQDPAGSSNTLALAVLNPVPAISSLAPASVSVGAPATNVVVSGSNFVAGTVASFGGAPRGTTVQSATQLTIALTAADLAVSKTASITVTNPAPGGGTSGASSFGVLTPAPTLTLLAPTSALVGSPGTPITLTGTNFTSKSQVSIGGVLLPSSFVSTTTLTTTIPAQNLTSAIPLSLSVQDPAGSSNTLAFAVLNPVPVISSLSPASLSAGGPATDVVVSGSNFVAGTVASFGGSPRATTVQSATQLTMALTAADLALAKNAAITVTNPAPGGGTSTAGSLSIVAGVPVITSLSPSSAFVGPGGSGIPDTPITIIGSNFDNNCKVFIGGFRGLPTTTVSSTTLTSALPWDLLIGAGSLSISVVCYNTGVTTNSLPFAVLNPPPVITSLSPAIVTAGAPPFMLTILGSGFLRDVSQLFINGTPRDIFNYLDGAVSLRIEASEVANAGTMTIEIVNPAPGGGTSTTLKLTIVAADNRLRVVNNLTANALAWDPTQKRIYAAIKATSSQNANSIVAIDPSSGTVVASHRMPSEPRLISITDDQQYLYVTMEDIESVARLKLPSLAPDIQWDIRTTAWPLNAIADMQAAPGLPHTVAVAQQRPGGGEVLTIFDDDVLRPKAATTGLVATESPADKIRWGADASTVYGEAYTDLFTFSIDSSGSKVAKRQSLVFGRGDFLYDRASARLYDIQGNSIDPTSGKLIGKFNGMDSNYTTAFTVDGANHLAYYLGRQFFLGDLATKPGTQIVTFDTDRFTIVDSIYLDSAPFSFPSPYGGTSIIRWGNAGLAFISPNAIYLLDGPFVTPGSAASSTTGSSASPAPQLSSVSPESVPVGSSDTVLTVRGKGFTLSTFLTWNGNVVASTMISPTEMQVTLPAAALISPVAGTITAMNDLNDAYSNGLGFSVLPVPSGAIQITSLNLPAWDVLWDSETNLLYVPVRSEDPLNGNTIALVDPVAGVIQSTLAAASDPYVLDVSGDHQYLYAGFTSSPWVQRFKLPSLTPDLKIPLGSPLDLGGTGGASTCDFAVSIKAAPQMPETIAVTQGQSRQACGGLVIFDGATPRSQTVPFGNPEPNFLTWGSDATSLYAQSRPRAESLYSFIVSPAGVAYDKTLIFQADLIFRPHFDPVTGYIYSDGGQVTDPKDGSQVGGFSASGLMVPDSKLGRAFFLGQTPDQSSTDSYTLQIFDLTKYTLLDSIVVPNVIGSPMQMVRWGTSGIAFTTASNDFYQPHGMTYILSGTAISGAGPAGMTTPAANTERVRMTWELITPHQQK